jgi:hypothetical protein
VIFIGDDWAEDHHDVHVMDEAGNRLDWRRLPEGLAGIGELHALIAAHIAEPDQVVIGIETDRGLWVEALSAAGYQLFAINPLAVARYRGTCQDNCVRCCGRLSLGHSGSRSGNWMAKVFSASVQR